MTPWDAVLLGIIQGLTEFLPVSSSGHLQLTQYILGFKQLQNYILFDLVCHLGTLLAITVVFLPHIKLSPLRIYQIILGTLPLFPLVLILKPIKNLFDQPEYLGLCFLFTSLILFLSTLKWPQREQNSYDPIKIGLFQAIAILPGISRSGCTISAARFLGWSKEEAFNFSFLLAIPAILGASVLEVYQLIKSPSSTTEISLFIYFTGFIFSFVIGCITLRLLKQMLLHDKWVYFAWYCLFLGLFTTYWINFSG
jgi:undecaprenyl-diphosphatase